MINLVVGSHNANKYWQIEKWLDFHHQLIHRHFTPGVQLDVGFGKTEYAVSESFGSVAPIVIIVEGNVSESFDIMITAVNGTALCKSLVVLCSCSSSLTVFKVIRMQPYSIECIDYLPWLPCST